MLQIKTNHLVTNHSGKEQSNPFLFTPQTRVPNTRGAPGQQRGILDAVSSHFCREASRSGAAQLWFEAFRCVRGSGGPGPPCAMPVLPKIPPCDFTTGNSLLPGEVNTSEANAIRVTKKIIKMAKCINERVSVEIVKLYRVVQCNCGH